MPTQHNSPSRDDSLAEPSEGTANRRTDQDRRTTTWRTFAIGALHVRRRASRRDADGHHLVDWHDAHLLVPVVSILLLSVADAFLTLKLVTLGSQELNPLMAWLLETNLHWFAAGKMALTGMGVLVLVAIARARVFGLVKVVNVLHWFFAAYVVLIGYEWLMLNRSL